eukprot:m.485829 g.485829  ORF g.485829 m.485829 type:complete len:451 (+) comp24000_c0_seq1:113-1465(+)
MGNCHVVGPEEVIVVSGGCCNNGKRVIIGGCAWAWCCVTDVQKISLNIVTLTPTCKSVETKEGVALTVNAVAQVRVMAEDRLSGAKPVQPGDDGMVTAQPGSRDVFLYKALEQFLGKSRHEFENTILQTLEGHLRAILGTLTVEEIYKDRETFAQLVRDVAATDVARMGIEILSFVIKDVKDDVDYLDSLGRAQTAVVQKHADIGKAEAHRDAGIAEAEADRERMQAKLGADTAIENSKRNYDMKRHEYAQIVNEKHAEADLAYQLQASKTNQLVRKEEIGVEVVERRRAIEVEEQEVLRKEKELIATVHRPAEAKSYVIEMEAEAEKTKRVLLAEGEAEAIKRQGAAEASVISAIGEAEANAMSARANAYKEYGDAAVTSLVLDALPEIAAEVAAPLAKTDEIVIIGGDGEGVTSEVSSLLSTLQPSVKALSGVDITQALKAMAGGSSV